VSTVTIEALSTITGGKRSKFKRIVISERNYLALKRLGYAGDSFNHVVSKLLRIERSYQEMKKQQEQQQEHQQESSDNSSSRLLSLLSPSPKFEEQNKQQIAQLVQLLRGKRRGKCSMDNQTNEQESNEQEP